VPFGSELFPETPLALLAQFSNPLVRPPLQLRMIAILPRARRRFERSDLMPAHEFFLSCFGQEAAALPAADDPVDIFEQLLGENNVCASGIHKKAHFNAN